MSPTDNNSNPNNLCRIVKKKKESRHFFHLSIVPAERDIVHYKMLAKLRKRMYLVSGTRHRPLWYALFKLSVETIVTFFFVSLCSAEKVRIETRFRIDIYDIKRDKKEKCKNTYV